MKNKDKTIFMTIPAYNDPQLIPTIESALANALYPERVHFCVGMQYDDDKMPDVSRFINNPNFTFIFYDVEKRPGVYWIRREMAEKHNGQDYFLMVDSHMIFAEYWDAKLINDYEDLRRLHGDRTIISQPTTLDVGSTIDNRTIDDRPHWQIDWLNNQQSVERTIVPWTTQYPWEGERYQRSYYSCSHFFFTNKDYLTDVGFHQTIRSYSEEYTIAITSYLSGWDYYALPETVRIGHDEQKTAKAIYNKDRYTLAEGKRYQAIFENDYEKKEIEKFVFLDNSEIFKVKNQRRSIDDFYAEVDEKLRDAREAFIVILGL